jgi:hypothetical protein
LRVGGDPVRAQPVYEHLPRVAVVEHVQRYGVRALGRDKARELDAAGHDRTAGR